MARKAAASSLVSEEGRLYEVPVLEWKTAAPEKMKWPLPPRPPPVTSLDIAVEKERLNAGIDLKSLKPDEYKMFRRTISNRISARKSRSKRSNYISENETRSDELTEYIDTLRPQIEAWEEKKKNLEEENVSLQAAIQARADQFKMAEKVTEELQAEIAQLKQSLAILSMNPVEMQPQPQPFSSMEGFYEEQQHQLVPENEPDFDVDQYLNLLDDGDNVYMGLDTDI